MTDSPADIARDIAAIERIGAIPSLLKLVCEHTGMGFAAVARVTDTTWVACAVRDGIHFGLKPGAQLDLKTTLCTESRTARQPVTIDHASEDPVYANHHTPALYKIQSYISVPIIRPGGAYFGNLCAIDPLPRHVSNDRTVTLFQAFADLIALQLDNEDRYHAANAALTGERNDAVLREQFIAVLGHDLRNPLASVGATAEVLARRADAPELARLGQRLRATTQRMSKLIDNVLDFARGRLGAGIGILAEDVTDLGAALNDVVMELREAHPGRAITAQIAVGGPLRCDRGRVQQLLSNLLGNAIAYGAEEHPIRVTAALDGGDLVMVVHNEGMPIPADHLPHLFQPYWRPADSKPGGGLGLGLYICSEIAKAHSGALQVASTARDGTTFTARLPVVVAAAPDAKALPG